MSKNHPASSLQIKTPRLKLIPCPLDVAEASIFNPSLVAEILGAGVPKDWQKTEVQDFLPMYAQMLVDDPTSLGWGVWLMIQTQENTLIGDLGFGGKPDESGSLEIGYEVFAAYRNQGYGFEAVQALVNWAFSHPELKRLIAHCPIDNLASVRILEKLGMERLHLVEVPELPNTQVWKWQLRDLQIKK
ncbi:GNAT family N-acetyltransferase [Phormidium sp. LEGE 05292]|uniref:GNAT family N-acetyltransferase n=1 Tax=[Phormidium] sp. LEGE 05292 TaxID=767427 RepID=UPI00187E45E3|nr:GNAT family N-acetyltransferase [Phormidium sp. LEGE 05292]MBE9229859.1 GNAT family N-acetyltransferase [Phormidium sp. LEGE 05292]